MIRALGCGARAVLLEVDSPEELVGLQVQVERLRAAGRLAGLTDVVPGARTLLLDGLIDPAAVAAAAPGWPSAVGAAPTGPEVTLEVAYDGEDLPEVARRWGMSPQDAAQTHAAQTYRVAFCGFAPGFAYLVGLPDTRAVPRRAAPRPRVPAGAVGIAGSYTGVYPRPSPGGWQLIGHTDAPLWDLRRQPAALLTPGTRVIIRRVG